MLPLVDAFSYFRRRWNSLATLAGAGISQWGELSATLSESLAGVAQSAERLHGKEEVRGSIPLSGSLAGQRSWPVDFPG